MKPRPTRHPLAAGIFLRRLLVAAFVCMTLAASLAGARAQGAPTITGFSPTSGPVGLQVTITGTGFTPPFSVTFGGGVSAAGSFTSTQIKVTVPSGAQTGVITIQTQSGTASTATAFTVGAANEIVFSGPTTGTGLLGQPFSLQIAASGNPTSYGAMGLPAGLSVNTSTGVISGSPTALGTFSVTLSAASASASASENFTLTISPLPFFDGETNLGSGVYYVAFPNGHNFGEYSYLANPDYLYSYDLTSYEYLTDAADGNSGIYLYDFASSGFFYTSPVFSYPYLYDFNANAVVYFYQGTSNPRYFYNFGTNKIITK